ncbi:3'-5' exonuclease [Sphingomonas sp. S1-29]|uniref:3'-5' exonuclease n=1 Tax=Sphingomonas sp. S1-29 TaxID=2991074 RepID=UPI00223F878D|nr:3'-5' exonuclease [Sphingomonas sp. S1-29]UZK68854.1 3'-5' exonuclease [Sphingomonas sp. S1-29]
MRIRTQGGLADAAAKEDVRVLRPLRLSTGATGDGIARGSHVGVAIDVETTSLLVETGKVIELAIRRFRYDQDGIITDIDEAYEWREDPGEPLTDEIKALTRLTDADLAGQEIDEDDATRLLQSASFVVAHNASFDRAWVERRLPRAAGLPWCCSMRQIDWRSRGFDGRVLGFLLVQNGFYHCGHRASSDVDALIQLLRHRDSDGRTGLSEMIATGSKPSWIVRARGAHFDRKDELRARGYRWDATVDRKVWWREVPDEDLVPEQFWLAANVYAAEARPHKISPEIVRVTPRTRFL